MTREELELLSYTDFSYMLLKENKKTMNTPALFKCICDMLEMSDDDFSNGIGDYYTSLTLDKRFLLLDNAEWDLTENHKVTLLVDDEDESIESNEEEEELDEDVEESLEDENLEEDEFESTDEIDDENSLDDLDDDTMDLSIVSEDELSEEN